MARSLSRFAQRQAFAGSMLVHAALVGLLVLSVSWEGILLPIDEAMTCVCFL